MSAPLVGAIGRIVSKGLDVNNRNIKNPKMIKAKTPIAGALRRSFFYNE